MCIENRKCGARVSLEDVGIFTQGCVRDTTWLNTISVPCAQSIFNWTIYIDLPDKKMTCLKTISRGKQGCIDEVIFETNNKIQKLYVKKPIIPGKSLIYEACIQKLVSESLADIGFPTGAPKIVSIFKLRDNSVCFAMEQIEGAITLDKYLESCPKCHLPNVIIDCLLQLSAMLWYLDAVLGINHRDLKPSNFLIVEHKPIRKIISVETEILEIESTHTLTFIDFGFSCLGSTETHIPNISLSTTYEKSDPCPKKGRDMFLFLAFLYLDFHQDLPPKLLTLFENWLEVPGSNLCHFMRKDKERSKIWLHFVSGNQNIKYFNCHSAKIVADLQSLI
jgi:serine/threonine protein kinase